MRFLLLIGTAGTVLTAPALALQHDSAPRDVVQTAERSVSDDSSAAVTARWSESLRRNSTDRAAALGLASLARVTYDFAAAERQFAALLARSGPTPDPWSIIRRGAPPREWAGFTVVGDPLARVPLMVPEDPTLELWRRVVGWSLILIAVAYWLVRRRGRRGERAETPAEVAATHH